MRKLPPDPDGQNDDRADWARTALRAFMRATGTDLEDALGDLLCDLRHWADRNGFDFDATCERSGRMYVEETRED